MTNYLYKPLSGYILLKFFTARMYSLPGNVSCTSGESIFSHARASHQDKHTMCRDAIKRSTERYLTKLRFIVPLADTVDLGRYHSNVIAADTVHFST